MEFFGKKVSLSCECVVTLINNFILIINNNNYCTKRICSVFSFSRKKRIYTGRCPGLACG